MTDNPLVTIICVCYNQELYVAAALDSVIAQHYNAIELIIIDDCSTDGSVAVIREWHNNHPSVRLIVNEQNLGPTKTFNKAAQYAEGDYLVDLAADDLLLPDSVALQVQRFHESPYSEKLAIVYGNAENITENGSFISYFFPVDANGKTIEKRPVGDIYISVLSGGNVLCSVAAMIKKAVFDKLGGYDESLAYEDLDFWIRSARNYWFDYVDTVLVQKRRVQHSLGTTFHQKKTAYSRKTNHSTYRILAKAYAMNTQKTENKALRKRIHHEIGLNFNNRNYPLVLRYIFLDFKTLLHS